MQNIEFDPECFTQSAQAKEDDNLLVKFYVKPRKDDAATVEAGRPIYKDVVYIDIKIPGDRNGGVARPATYQDKQRFQRHFKAFNDRTTSELEQGTSLAEWPLIPRSMVEELAFFNVKTVEHLVSMSDGNAQKFSGINALRTKAADWLKKAEGDSVEVKLRAELEERTAKVVELSGLVEKMSSRLSQLEQEGKTKTKAK